jgi:transposase
LGLPDYEITGVHEVGSRVRIQARFTGEVACPHCGGRDLRNKGRAVRILRHESWGVRTTEVHLETRKWLCRVCVRQFWQRMPGVLSRMRSTEPFRRSVCQKHFDGISRSRLAKRERISSATIERWFGVWLRQIAGERASPQCPEILGIDEHFFTRRLGYATTFCDLKNHRVFDVVLGRSEAALERYLSSLKGKDAVKVVCIDLSATYRAIVRRHFPNAKIVADRFHAVRIVNHHFLACWKDIDPRGSKHRGLVSLMRRHRHRLSPEQSARLALYLRECPVMEQIYRFKQKLMYLLLEKHHTKKKCRQLAGRLLSSIQELKNCGIAPLVQLGETLHSWRNEIATMWRFTRNNGITEGFHTKMEAAQRAAYGYRNFQNYRLRVRVLCS